MTENISADSIIFDRELPAKWFWLIFSVDCLGLLVHHFYHYKGIWLEKLMSGMNHNEISRS